jgi:hypothetical protein
MKGTEMKVTFQLLFLWIFLFFFQGAGSIRVYYCFKIESLFPLGGGYITGEGYTHHDISFQQLSWFNNNADPARVFWPNIALG